MFNFFFQSLTPNSENNTMSDEKLHEESDTSLGRDSKDLTRTGPLHDGESSTTTRSRKAEGGNLPSDSSCDGENAADLRSEMEDRKASIPRSGMKEENDSVQEIRNGGPQCVSENSALLRSGMEDKEASIPRSGKEEENDSVQEVRNGGPQCVSENVAVLRSGMEYRKASIPRPEMEEENDSVQGAGMEDHNALVYREPQPRRRYHEQPMMTGHVPHGVPLSYTGKTLAYLHRENAKLKEHLQECHAQRCYREHQSKLKMDYTERLVKHIERREKHTRAVEAANINLQQKLERAEEQIRKERAGLDILYIDGLPTPFLLDSAAKDVFTTISSFTSLYSKYRSSDGSLAARSLLELQFRELNCREPYMTRDQHWVLLLKSVVCSRLFHNFETEEFLPFEINHNTTLFLNPEDRVSSCFSLFKGSSSSAEEVTSTTCVAGNDKLLSLYHDYLSSTSSHILTGEIRQFLCLFGTDGQVRHGDPEVEEGCANQLTLLKSFIITAKKVWAFHKLCLSFEPPATIFRVAVGDPFIEDYMDSNDTIEADEKFVPRVGFMIYPGFRLRKSVIKSRVYFGV